MAATPSAGFNTQPPEGGWARGQFPGFQIRCFNTQPPEGGWPKDFKAKRIFHGFNTQPPEGGWLRLCVYGMHRRRFNTQPPEGGWDLSLSPTFFSMLFQHTAARRRLVRPFD